MYHRNHIEEFLNLPHIKTRDDVDDALKAAALSRIDQLKDASGYFASGNLQEVLGSEKLATLFEEEWQKLTFRPVAQHI